MKELTHKQAEIVRFIARYLGENGAPPTRKEIGDAFGVSTSVANSHLYVLDRKGYIDFREGVNRNVRLTATAWQMLADEGLAGTDQPGTG